MKFKAFIVALHAALFGVLLAVSPAGSGSMMLLGAGKPGATAYSGPGDSTTFILWGSVARVYSLAKASTSTQMADLVDSAAPTVVICTLRGSAAGTVDLVGTYCTGGVTPSVKCAAATGGACNVSKLYDQVGTNHWVQTTALNQPTLTFSALSGLPALTFNSANSQILTTGANVSQAAPYVFQVVSKRTSNINDDTIIEVTFSSQSLSYRNNGGTGNLIQMYGGNALAPGTAITETSPHVIQAGFVNGTGTFNIDGATQVTVAFDATTTNGPSALGSGFDGQISEGGIFSGNYNAGVQSNARIAYGL